MPTSNTIKLAGDAHAATAQPAWDSIRRTLLAPRGLVILGIAIIAGGLALGWGWLTAVGLAPIILALAPCAAMCAIGVCAMSRRRASPTSLTTPDKADPAASVQPNGSQTHPND